MRSPSARRRPRRRHPECAACQRFTSPRPRMKVRQVDRCGPPRALSTFVTVDFGLLGPLMVSHDGATVPVARGHQRAVLASLLLQANHPVPPTAIAEALWEDAPPPSAQATVRNYVRRLRHTLRSAGAQRIGTHPGGGYLIQVGDGELDVARFEKMLSAAWTAGRLGSWSRGVSEANAELGNSRGQPVPQMR